MSEQRRWVKLFSGAVAGQAMLSAANFIAGLLLIRHTTDLDYGHYVLATSALLLMTGLQGAAINGPLTVIASRYEPGQRLQMVGAYHGMLQRWWLVGGLVLLTAIVPLFLGQFINTEEALVLVAVVLAVWAGLKRDYVRSSLLMYTQSPAVLRADMVFVLLMLAGVALAAYLTTPAAPWAIAGLAAASLAGALHAERSFGRLCGWVKAQGRADFRLLWRLGVWAASGCLLSWTFSQGYGFVVAAKLDVAAVAALAATRLLLMPVNLLTAGIKQLLLPMAVGWLRDHGMSALLRRLAAFIAITVVLSLIYCGLLWVLRDWLVPLLLGKSIPGFDVLLLLWSGIFVLALVRDLAMTALMAREQFQVLTWLALACAVLALGIAWWGMQVYGAEGALIGLLSGEALNLLGVLVLVVLNARSPG